MVRALRGKLTSLSLSIAGTCEQQLVRLNIHECQVRCFANVGASTTPPSQHPRVSDNNSFNWKFHLRSVHAQLQIVNTLRLGEKERAYELLHNLGGTNGSLSPDDFGYVLDYCAKTPDPLFVMETWRIMEEKEVTMDIGCYKSVIEALAKGGYLQEAFNWLAFVGANDFPNSVLPLYNIFLNNCGSRKSSVDTDRCLELMESHLLGKSEITYYEILKLLVEQKNLSAVHDIWKECTRYYSPSVITLRKFIWSFTKLNDVESAYAVLQYMVTVIIGKSASVRISSAGRYHSSRLDIPVPSYNELHNTFGLKNISCLQNSMPRATVTSKEGANETCVDKGLRLSRSIAGPSHVPITFRSRICDPEDKGRIYSLMFPSAVDSCGSHNQYLQQEEFLELELEDVEQQQLGFEFLKERKYQPVKNILRWSFSDLILACAREKNCKLAEHLFMQMLKFGLEPSQSTYDGLVRAVICEKGVAYSMKVVEFMKKRNVKPSNITLAALSTCHSKNLELDIAESLLEKFSGGPKYIHPFNDILAACDIMDQPERAVRILAKMKHLNIQSNIRTYELLFSLFGNVNVPYEKGNSFSHADARERINAIEKDMIKSGIQHSYTSMKNLIRAVGAEGMIGEMLVYFNRAENMLWKLDSYQISDLYNIVLHALLKAKKSSTALVLFERMKQIGFPADMATYNMMIDCCSILPSLKSASALLSMMLQDGFVPQSATYTALLKVLLATDKFGEALHLLDQAVSVGIQLDIHLFNTVLKQAHFKGRIDIIELIIELSHREKINPDPSTCWYTFCAYVDCGFESTAMEALQVLSMRMISGEYSNLEDHKAAFDDLIYSEEPDAELKIIQLFKESREFVATALLNLRWCAINGAVISCSLDESLWGKRLSSSYDAKRKRLFLMVSTSL